jgi:hypothetical protein
MGSVAFLTLYLHMTGYGVAKIEAEQTRASTPTRRPVAVYEDIVPNEVPSPSNATPVFATKHSRSTPVPLFRSDATMPSPLPQNRERRNRFPNHRLIRLV